MLDPNKYSIINYKHIFAWLSYLYASKLEKGETIRNTTSISNIRVHTLWHGTTTVTLANIQKTGFDWRYANRFIYGKGLYMTNKQDIAWKFALQQAQSKQEDPCLIECACIIDWSDVANYTVDMSVMFDPPIALRKTLNNIENMGSTTIVKFSRVQNDEKFAKSAHTFPSFEKQEIYTLHGQNYFIFQNSQYILPIRYQLEQPSSMQGSTSQAPTSAASTSSSQKKHPSV